MSKPDSPLQAAIPSVDRILGLPAVMKLIHVHGRALVTDLVRSALADVRDALLVEGKSALPRTTDDTLVAGIKERLERLMSGGLVPVFNLTGTVVHTNLGRALLPDEVVEAMRVASTNAVNLEFDLKSGRRGQRDDHVSSWICRLTGAEAATAINNNAAAVMLVLNTLALRREVIVSRGELIEIGGSFRMPEIMARAGCKLKEVGTTNRTHLSDYMNALNSKSAMIMKVHTSNYKVQGFSSNVAESDLATLAHENGLPFIVDLGSGSLVDLEKFGLPHEQTPTETLESGADLVTFSGDKLMGGPQAGFIVGRTDLINRLNKNPMKRAFRLDKARIAALAALLKIYANPDRLLERLPTLRLLTRPLDEIQALALRLQPKVAEALDGHAEIKVVPCHSQIGSGSLPIELLESAALSIHPLGGKRGLGAVLRRIAKALRELPIPVIGRIHNNAVLLDLRCLEDDTRFVEQLPSLQVSGRSKV